MRSRYSGFALGRAPYLLETLAPTHPDRTLESAAHLRELASIRDVRRFMGLQVFGDWVSGDDGEVLFIAKLFERGQSVGFAEHSRFVRVDGRWLYASGALVPLRDLPAAMAAKPTREEFLPFARAYAAARTATG
jgi:SEC-C motif-containing protein